MKRFALGASLLAILSTVVFAASQPADKPQPDARLDQKVTIKTVGKPLGDFLALLSEATGVEMTARKDVADYRVCMYVKDVPLSRLQGALEEVLRLQHTQQGKPGEWSYEFWEDARTRQEIDRLKKQELDEFRAVVQKLVEDLKLSDKELTTKFGRKKDIPYALQYPRDRSLLKAYSLVDKPHLETLWQKGTLRLDKTDLSSDLQSGLVQGLNESDELDLEEPSGEPVPTDGVDTGDYPGEFEFASDWIAVDSIDFKVEDSGCESGMRLVISVAGKSVGISGNDPKNKQEIWSGQDISVGPKEYANTPAADPVEAMLADDKDKDASEPEWPIGRYVEELSIAPMDDGEYTEEASADEATVEAEGPRPLTHYQMLVMIAEKTGTNMISDRFASVDVPAWVVSEKPGDWPLSVIDKLAEGMNADTMKDAELRLFVNREWFRNRDREVPERLVKRWMPIAKKLGYLELEQIIEVSSLTDPQVMSLGSYGLPYAGQVAEDRERLHLLASLTPKQWTAIKSEDGLPISSLSDTQRQEFMDWLTQNRAETFEWVSDDPEPTPPGELQAIRVTPEELDWDDNGRKVISWDFTVCSEHLESTQSLPSAIGYGAAEATNGYGIVEISVAGKP